MQTGVKVSLEDFDNDPQQLIAYYEALADAHDEMVKKMTVGERNASGIYEEINTELAALADGYSKAKEHAEILQEANIKVFNNEGFANGLFSNVTDINSLYENRDAMAAAYVEQFGGTLEQATKDLQQTDAYKELYNTLNFLETSTEVHDASTGEVDKEKSQERLKAVLDWFNGLPPEDKTLIFSVDFGAEDISEDALNAQLAEAKQRQLIAQDEEYALALQKKSVDQHKLEKETVEALTETLKDEDVVIKGLSKDVKNNATESAELADDILRFGKAADAARDKIDD